MRSHRRGKYSVFYTEGMVDRSEAHVIIQVLRAVRWFVKKTDKALKRLFSEVFGCRKELLANWPSM